MVPCLHLISLGGWVVGRCSVSKQGVAYTLQPIRIRFVQYSLLSIRIGFISCILQPFCIRYIAYFLPLSFIVSPMSCVLVPAAELTNCLYTALLSHLFTKVIACASCMAPHHTLGMCCTSTPVQSKPSRTFTVPGRIR